MLLPDRYLPDVVAQFDAAQRAATHVVRRPRRDVVVAAPPRTAGSRTALLLTLLVAAVTAALRGGEAEAGTEAGVPLWRSEAFAEDLLDTPWHDA